MRYATKLPRALEDQASCILETSGWINIHFFISVLNKKYCYYFRLMHSLEPVSNWKGIYLQVA